MENACSRKDINLVDYLLGLDINNDKLLSMFIASIRANNLTIADKIINYGFRIGDECQEILNNPSYRWNLETIKYLIHNGLDINKHGSQLLLCACRQCNSELIEFYLENNLTADHKILDTIFEESKLNIIEIFAKNFTNLSMVKFKNATYNSLMKSLKNNSLDMMSFLKYLLKYIDYKNRKYDHIFQQIKK